MGDPAPMEQHAVQIYPCGRRGDFAAFVGGGALCACGATSLPLGRLKAGKTVPATWDQRSRSLQHAMPLAIGLLGRRRW